MSSDAYRSIFLSPDWQHVRYLGWQDSWPHPQLRVMRQTKGPLERLFILNEIADSAEFLAAWQSHVGDLSAMREIRLHDFTGSNGIGEALQARGLKPLTAKERMLNIMTIVIDLAPDEEALRAQLSSDTRRKLRKAEETSQQFVVDASDAVPDFIAAFNKMASERSLQAINEPLVRRMIDDRMARLFGVRDDSGWRNFLLAYEADDTGIFLQGAATGHDNDGAGQLLQWGTMLALKAGGRRWYDMGGIVSTDSSNGIYRFKKGFGGEVVELGTEYGGHGWLYGLARKVLRK